MSWANPLGKKKQRIHGMVGVGGEGGIALFRVIIMEEKEGMYMYWTIGVWCIVVGIGVGNKKEIINNGSVRGGKSGV